MELEELIRQYNPRAAVPDHEVWKAHWGLDSERARRTLQGHLRVPYGDTPGQCMDVFPAKAPGAPVQVFVHGGFWRFLDSFDHTLIAPMFHEAGAATVLLNYDLCPTVPLSEVITQIRRGLKAVYDRADEYGYDRDKLFISGHSAGGHLCAMLAATDCAALGMPADAIKGATFVSGLFDLTPMLQVPGGEDLQITAKTVPDVSPLWNLPPTHMPLIIAVGGHETREWIRQTDDFVAKCRANGSDVTALMPDYDNHYSILYTIGNPVTELGQAILRQMGLEG